MEVVGNLKLQRLIKRRGVETNLVKPAIHLVEAVGNVWKQDWLVLLEKSIKGVRQHLIGSVSDEYVVGLERVMVSDSLLQAGRLGIRIQAQGTTGSLMQCRQHCRRGWIGVFVGMELDQPWHAGMLTG